MAFVVGGWLFAAAGLLWLALMLYISFDTEGGSLGMVPILDSAVIAPTFFWAGVGMLERGGGWAGWPLWAYAAAWIASVIGAECLLEGVGRIGARWHRRPG
jgi:hypothetical protein